MTTTVSDSGARYRDVVGRELRHWHDAVPEWLRQRREAAAEGFAKRGFPSPREEAWRYTSLEFLDRHAFVPTSSDPGGSLRPGDLEGLGLAGSDAARLVFVNGRFAPALSDPVADAPGVALGGLAEWLRRDPARVRAAMDALGAERAGDDAFAMLNTALAVDGAFIHVAEGAKVGRPVELLHVSVGTDAPAMIHPRHLIVVGAGATASVIERYAAIGEPLGFTNSVVEILLGEGAGLRHDRLQEESPNGYHLATLRIAQAGASRYHQVTASLGGAWARTGVTLEFTGEQAAAELDGLYLAGDRQLNDIHLDVRHEVPNCTSRESYRGILDGRGRAVFDGRVLVSRDAQHTDARLSNDNLVLSRAAEVDTKPQLEIYADDVRCSHGTTVGQLDEDMLFYLRSRGIGQEAARQMLCLGFAGEVLDAFGSAAASKRAGDLLALRLGGASRSGH